MLRRLDIKALLITLVIMAVPIYDHWNRLVISDMLDYGLLDDLVIAPFRAASAVLSIIFSNLIFGEKFWGWVGFALTGSLVYFIVASIRKGRNAPKRREHRASAPH